jgi:hypothetical protein
MPRTAEVSWLPNLFLKGMVSLEFSVLATIQGGLSKL